MEKDIPNDIMIEAFINTPEKTTWYENTFEKYQMNNDKIVWNWSWWAFFGGWLFLLYRKTYLPAIGLFILTAITASIPVVSLIIMILSGGYSTYFIYSNYLKKKNEIESYQDTEEKHLQDMRKIGGVHTWVIWLVVIVNVLVVSSIIFYLMTASAF